MSAKARLIETTRLAAFLLAFHVEGAHAGSPPSGGPDDPVHPLMCGQAPLRVVADLHCDTLFRIHSLADYRLSRRDPRRAGPNDQVDLPRLKAAGFGVQVFAAWVPSSLAGSAATAFADRLLDVLDQQARRESSQLTVCRTSGDVEKAVSAGKVAAIASIEGGHALGEPAAILSAIEHFRSRGVRIISLTWNNSSALATSAVDAARRRDRGLTEVGEAAVAALIRSGILVDVSHASPESAREALAIAKEMGAPVIASHSNCMALHPVPRNISDALIRGIHEVGGVVAVSFNAAFVGRGSVGVARLVDHIDHIRQTTGGVETISLGSDFDGGIRAIRGLEDPSHLNALVAELLRRGYTCEEIAAIAGGNFLRTLAAAERAAQGTR